MAWIVLVFSGVLDYAMATGAERASVFTIVCLLMVVAGVVGLKIAS